MAKKVLIALAALLVALLAFFALRELAKHHPVRGFLLGMVGAFVVFLMLLGLVNFPLMLQVWTKAFVVLLFVGVLVVMGRVVFRV